MTRLIIYQQDSCWKTAGQRTFLETSNTQLEPVCQIFQFANQIQWKGVVPIHATLHSPDPSVHFHRVTHKANNGSFLASIVNLTRIVQNHFTAWTELIQFVQNCFPHLLLQSLCHLVWVYIYLISKPLIYQAADLLATTTKNLPVCFSYELQEKE